ncbi:type II secretion system F family protein [Desulfonatronum thiodismutans]|uniref:type II secretion system F family protein n=1 Tax=Desulfonatronum thiodismutans TaxID=159290 RepID=UPI00068CDBF0|nr:type II secretion system F family protein [Desulfonatronum thiodismutans]
MSTFILITIIALVAAAGFLFVRQFFSREGEAELLESLGVKTGQRETKSPLLRVSRPFILYLTQFTQDIKILEWRRKRQREIQAAGMLDEITVEELLAYKFFLAILFFLALLIYFSGAAWWVFIVVPLLGFFYPDRWLGDRKKKRAHEIVRALPDVVDMLALSVEAGLDFVAAVNKVVRKSRPGPLVHELGLVINEMRLGATRSDAFRNMAFRCDVRELSSFVSILVQADKLGVSIGKVLRAQSDKMRTERFQKAERLGAIASQKLLFPLVLCIMPAIFIVFFGPLIVRFVTGTLM